MPLPALDALSPSQAVVGDVIVLVQRAVRRGSQDEESGANHRRHPRHRDVQCLRVPLVGNCEQQGAIRVHASEAGACIRSTRYPLNAHRIRPDEPGAEVAEPSHGRGVMLRNQLSDVQREAYMFHEK